MEAKKSWFGDCRTAEEVKAKYRNLMKQFHPDAGGPDADLQTCQEINAAMDAWARDGMGSAFREYERTTGRGFAEEQPHVFADILAKLVKMAGVGRIEIIGYWIYAFDSFDAKEELKGMGFWFSGKHKAWIYSGRAKVAIKSRLTTADVRRIHGSIEIAKEHEEAERRQAITA